MSTDILRALRVLSNPGQIIEVRAITDDGGEKYTIYWFRNEPCGSKPDQCIPIIEIYVDKISFHRHVFDSELIHPPFHHRLSLFLGGLLFPLPGQLV
jgi:hypothetical protein